MYLYIYIYVYMYTCIYIYIYVYMYPHIDIYVFSFQIHMYNLLRYTPNQYMSFRDETAHLESTGLPMSLQTMTSAGRFAN